MIFLRLLLVFLCVWIAACTLKTDEPSSELKSSPSPVKIRLTEGTNLAVAVNPSSGDRVLALQGTLYLQSAGEIEAHAITQWHDDAWEPTFSPDGKSVVYKGYRDGSFDLWQLAIAAKAEPVKLTEGPFDDREPQFSYDGSRIIFSSDRSGSYDIWQLDLLSSELTMLTQTDAEAHSPSWSPDAKAFAYVTTDRQGSKLFIQSNTKATRQILDTKARLSGVQWYGKSLSFRTLERDESGNAYTRLQLLDVNSGEISDLSKENMDVFPFRSHWSDGSVIFAADGKVQQRSSEGNFTVLEFSVDIELQREPYQKKQRDFDSHEAKPVLGISYPAVSPDGTLVAFGALGDLWLWDARNSDLSQLTDDPGADQSPSWTANGKQLAYISDKDGHPRIQILTLENRKLESLQLPFTELSFPSWSPDGRQLAFFTDVPGNPLLHVVGQLTVYNLDSQKTKTYLSPMPPQPINWSGDGSHLLTTRLYPYSKRFREGVYLPVIVNLATGEDHKIVPHPHRSVTHASLAADNRLVYVQNGALNTLQLDEHYQIHGEPKILVNDLADSPSISRSGESVVFQSGAALKQIRISDEMLSDISPPMQWTLDHPSEQWVLRVGRMFDGVSSSYLENVDIHIHDNRIVAVGPIDTATPLRVVDASEHTVIPGLFESHAHIGDHNHSEPQGRAWLAYGITSVRDPGSNPYLANERREAWSSGRRIGPRTFITGHNMDGNRVFYAVVEGIATDEHLERALRRSQALDVDFIKTYVRMSDKRQHRVLEFAHKLGIPVTSHELLPAAAFGVDHIEHFTGTSRRGYATKISELGRAYQDVIEVLTQSGMGIVPTMVVPGVVLTFEEQSDLYSTPQFNAFYGESAKKNYQDFMGFFGPGSEGYVDAYGELLSELIKRKALVGTGTDSPFTPFATGLHAELRLYQREGLEPYQILHAATLQSARIAGVEADLGSIEAGKLADMVVIDGDPLNDVSDLSKIVYTIKNGRLYSLDQLLQKPE